MCKSNPATGFGWRVTPIFNSTATTVEKLTDSIPHTSATAGRTMSYPPNDNRFNSVHIPSVEAHPHMSVEPDPELRSQINAQLLRDGHIDRYVVTLALNPIPYHYLDTKQHKGASC